MSGEDDDGEIPVRPLVKRSFKQFLGRKDIFDPLSIPTPSASPDVNAEDDDDDGLIHGDDDDDISENDLILDMAEDEYEEDGQEW